MEGMLRRLIGKHIDFELRLDPQTSRIHVDPGQMEQIILNLVVNAADAMPEGGRLEVRLEDVELDDKHVAEHADARPGRHVLLSVADSGTGISTDVMEHIYEPFFTTKPVGKGTGLGLATVYGTVKRLGGHIRVQSEPGEGSTFNVCIPVADEQLVESKPHTERAASCAGETILLCEDQQSVRRVMCQTLRAAGYTVIEAADGRQALEMMAGREGTIDLLISDVVMPGISGKELADRLTPAHPGIRVLLVSGYAADHLDVRARQGGTMAFLQKPFGPTDLLNRVREVLDLEGLIQ